MNRWEAIHQFWSSFGVPAYERNSTPDIKTLSFPYITYEAAVGSWEDIIPLTASIWDKSTSWRTIADLSDTIERTIRLSLSITYDDGMYRVWIGDTPFSQNMGDPEDDKIKRKLLTVNFEFMDTTM